MIAHGDVEAMYALEDMDPTARRPLFIAKMKWWKQPGEEEATVFKNSGNN